LQCAYFLPLVVVVIIESERHHLEGIIHDTLTDPQVR
jgi:hypothetical protein